MNEEMKQAYRDGIFDFNISFNNNIASENDKVRRYVYAATIITEKIKNPDISIAEMMKNVENKYGTETTEIIKQDIKEVLEELSTVETYGNNKTTRSIR